MTFGKVNEMGQFIREAEPEPDVKKSKGVTDWLSLLSTCQPLLCPFISSESLLSLSHSISLLFVGKKNKNIYCTPVNIKLM